MTLNECIATLTQATLTEAQKQALEKLKSACTPAELCSVHGKVSEPIACNNRYGKMVKHDINEDVRKFDTLIHTWVLRDWSTSPLVIDVVTYGGIRVAHKQGQPCKAYTLTYTPTHGYRWQAYTIVNSMDTWETLHARSPIADTFKVCAK